MQCDPMPSLPLLMTFLQAYSIFTTLCTTASAFITETPQLTSHLFQVDEHE